MSNYTFRRGDKDILAAGLLVVASTTIACAAQQNLPAPRVTGDTSVPATVLPAPDQNVDVVSRLEVNETSGKTGGKSEPSCNGRLALRERFRSWKARHQEAWLGYADEFNERPLGSAIHDTFDKQRYNGEAALMVLHHQDFGFGRDVEELNPRGRDELRKIVELLPRNFSPVVIERSSDPRLDERRRQTVLAELNSGLFPVPDERVIIGPPVAFGLNGVEAGLIQLNLLNQTESRGRSVGATGTTGPTTGVGTGMSNRPTGSYSR